MTFWFDPSPIYSVYTWELRHNGKIKAKSVLAEIPCLVVFGHLEILQNYLSCENISDHDGDIIMIKLALRLF